MSEAASIAAATSTAAASTAGLAAGLFTPEFVANPYQTYAFLHAMKDPFHERRRSPSRVEVEVRQRDLLTNIFGVDAAGLEKQWRAFVGKDRGRK